MGSAVLAMQYSAATTGAASPVMTTVTLPATARLVETGTAEAAAEDSTAVEVVVGVVAAVVVTIARTAASSHLMVSAMTGVSDRRPACARLARIVAIVPTAETTRSAHQHSMAIVRRSVRQAHPSLLRS